MSWLEIWAMFQVIGIWIQIFFAVVIVLVAMYFSYQNCKFEREREAERRKKHVDLSKHHEKEARP